MIKLHEIPDWFELPFNAFDPNVIASITVAYERNGDYYFDGTIAAMLGLNKIPHSIEIAYDAEAVSCIARLNYGNEDDKSAIYCPFEIESFAFLWNANPKTIHGIQGNRVTLNLKESENRYPFINSVGMTSELYLRDSIFFCSPHPDYLHEAENIA